jgi:hypothetical protein
MVSIRRAKVEKGILTMDEVESSIVTCLAESALVEG